MRSRPRPLWLSVAASTCALLVAGTTYGGPAAADQSGVDPSRAAAPGVYVVTLRDRPAASYAGGIDGYPATRPRPGRRFDRTLPAVAGYARLLLTRQERLLERVGDPDVLYRYTTALDGFAARLTSEQVDLLRRTPQVALVERSTKRRLAGVPAPGPRDATAARGTWAAAGGPPRAGKGTVIGVVDSGIWPENPSFAGLAQSAPGTWPALPGFHGSCNTGQQWTARACSDKVVSARWFVEGFGADHLSRSEYLSPRDSTGHGTHAASVAAGDHGVRVQIDGQSFGTISGLAPAARIAVYKACWSAPDPAQDGCTTADTVAAVDQAVADGVDVLSYSVTGSHDPGDSVERAFLNAAAAGVFVAAAAGNGGPGAGSVGHAAPWVTTVGASTHHLFLGGLRLGNGREYVGAMVSDRKVAPTGLLLAGDAAAPGSTRRQARLCRVGSLDADRVQDQIVVCDRGVVPRVDKSTAVARAGGAGMVLANTGPGTTAADAHAVPTVHLDVAAAEAVKAYAAAAGGAATASLDPTATAPVPVPTLAAFSARGPVAGTGGDLLKPDLTAPGVSVLGAVAPDSDSGRMWDLASGTSTSTPQVAGLAAAVMARHPEWPPARTKSAMMTTARDLEGGAGPFAEGAGAVAAAGVADPGLVLDCGPAAWHRYLDGRLPAGDLNLPSVVVGDLVGSATSTRRVTSVASTAETYTASVRGLPGLRVDVRPRTFTVRPGHSRRVTIRVRATADARLGTFERGWLTLTGRDHRVRLPVAVRPGAVAAPRLVHGTGGSGTVRVRGRSGTGTPVAVHASGLAPANPTGLTLVPGGFDPARPVEGPGTFATSVPVPAGTEVARFVLSTHNPGDDVGLYLYRGRRLVGSDTADSPDAALTLENPEAGDYTLYATAPVAGNGAAATGQLYTWVVGRRAADGNLRLSRDAVGGTVPGERFGYRASWRGLDPTKKWLGVLRYAGSDRRTLVQVD